MSKILLGLSLLVLSVSGFAQKYDNKVATCSLIRYPMDNASDHILDRSVLAFREIGDKSKGYITDDENYLIIVDQMHVNRSKETKIMETTIAVRLFYKKKFVVETATRSETDGHAYVRVELPDPSNPPPRIGNFPVTVRLSCDIELKEDK